MIILKSLLITAVISSLFAFSLRNIIGFWEMFSLSYAIQIIIAFVLSSKKITSEQQIIDKFTDDIEELLDMSIVSVECPCGKNKFDTAVFASIDNNYDCGVCGNKFRADITITPTLITVPEPTNVSKILDKVIDKKEL